MTIEMRGLKKTTTQQITELRKSNKLDEALELSNSLTKEDLDNIWNKRAISWVYYNYLKKYADDLNTEKFLEFLNKLKDLELPEDEKMLFDNLAFVIFKVVNSSFKQTINTVFLDKIFDIIKNFAFTKKQTSYSALFKAFQKGKVDWNYYIEFVDWWGLENFIIEDFQPYKLDNGKEIMSLAEQAYIGYAKRLLQKLENPLGNDNEKDLSLNQAKGFLEKLSKLIDLNPEYKYPPYFKAKLLIATGGEDVLQAILPFAKIMKHSFWVWDLLSDIFPKGNDNKMACLCKALSLKTNNNFLNKVRKKLLPFLIENEFYAEAKKEIEIIEQTISKNDWKVDFSIIALKKENWYIKSSVSQSNDSFYALYAKKAELILFGDIPSDIITIKFIDKNSNLLYFISNKKIEGHFKYLKVIKNPNLGEVYNVKLKTIGTEGYNDVYSAARITKEDSKVLKSFSGEINITEKGYGFVNNIFFSNFFIKKHKIIQNQFLKGESIISYDKKKDVFGYTVLNID